MLAVEDAAMKQHEDYISGPHHYWVLSAAVPS